jgi:hypothetical protein
MEGSHRRNAVGLLSVWRDAVKSNYCIDTRLDLMALAKAIMRTTKRFGAGIKAGFINYNAPFMEEKRSSAPPYATMEQGNRGPCCHTVPCQANGSHVMIYSRVIHILATRHQCLPMNAPERSASTIWHTNPKQRMQHGKGI